MSRPTDLVQGPLDLLILKTIALEPMHGCLHKLEHHGFIRAAWDVSDNNRRAKYYSLTRAGGKRLAHQLQSWERQSAAVTMVAKASEV